MNKEFFRNVIIVFGIFILIFLSVRLSNRKSEKQNKQAANLSAESTLTPILKKEIPPTIVVAENLDTPWGIAFLPASPAGRPDGGILITERPGRVRLIDSTGVLEETPVTTLTTVKEIGEGGLLGIALHPNFASNHYIYIYYTYEGDENQTFNRVVRTKYADKKLTNEQILVDKIPGGPNHNGGRIKFGPDNFLYITTGDSQNPSLSQDKNSLAGKILRVTDDGKPAPNSPFNNLVYSYGHRNPQGLAWDSSGRLWTTEHGRSGAISGLDEINLIERGKNYGWPTIQGDEKKRRDEISASSFKFRYLGAGWGGNSWQFYFLWGTSGSSII